MSNPRYHASEQFRPEKDEYIQGESNPHRIESHVATMHDTISP